MAQLTEEEDGLDEDDTYVIVPKEEEAAAKGKDKDEAKGEKEKKGKREKAAKGDPYTNIDKAKAMEVAKREKLKLLQQTESAAKAKEPEDDVEYAAAYEEALVAAMNGDFVEAGQVNASQAVHVFISSTIEDTSVEREYLQLIVLPQLDNFCRELGFEFSSVRCRATLPPMRSQRQHAHRSAAPTCCDAGGPALGRALRRDRRPHVGADLPRGD